MSKQLGSCFVKKLQQLGIKESENLDGASIDWVFMSPENDPLKEFVSWFCENVSSTDVLTEEEIKEYAALEEAGEVLEGTQLENMSQCLVGLEGLATQNDQDLIEVAFRSSTHDEYEEFDKEMGKLEKQIQRVNLRKNQISMEMIKMSANLDDQATEISEQQSVLSRQQTSALSAAQELSDNFVRLSQIIEKLSTVIKKIPLPEMGYLLSTDLTALREEEHNLSQSLKHFIKKQFPLNSLSSSVLDNKLTQVEEDEFSLVRSLDSDSYSKQMNQLNRLKHLIEENELECISEQVRDSRFKAEIEEANTAMERVKRGYYGELSQTNIQQEIQSSEVQHRVSSEEVCRQEKTLSDTVRNICERHTTRTLSADAITTLSRQQYFQDKQELIEKNLLDQLSRQNLVTILLECEAEKLRISVEEINKSKEFLRENLQQSGLRYDYLKTLSDETEEHRMLGKLPSTLTTLGKMLNVRDGETGNNPITIESGGRFNSTVSSVLNNTMLTSERSKAVESLTKLLSEKENAQQHLCSQHHPYSYRINKLIRKCELLEESLSGGAANHRLPGVLPASFLPADLIDKQYEVEEQVIHFKNQMMDLLLQYETKKKMVAAQPELLSKLNSWTKT